MLWNIKIDDGSDNNGLELNGYHCENMLWNVMGVDEQDWDRNELKRT